MGYNEINTIVGPSAFCALIPKEESLKKYIIFLFSESHEKDITMRYECNTSSDCYRMDSTFIEIIDDFAKQYTKIKIQFYVEQALNLLFTENSESTILQERDLIIRQQNTSNMIDMSKYYRSCFYKNSPKIYRHCPYKHIHWQLTDARYIFLREQTTEESKKDEYGYFQYFIHFLHKFFELLYEASHSTTTTTQELFFFEDSPNKKNVRNLLISFLRNYSKFYHKKIYLIDILSLTEYVEYTKIILSFPVIQSQFSDNTPEQLKNPEILKNIFETDITSTISRLKGFELNTFLIFLKNLIELFKLLDYDIINNLFSTEDRDEYNIEYLKFNSNFDIFYDKFKIVSSDFDRKCVYNYVNLIYGISSGILDIYFVLRIFKRDINNNIIFSYFGMLHLNNIVNFLCKYLDLKVISYKNPTQNQSINIENEVNVNNYFKLRVIKPIASYPSITTDNPSIIEEQISRLPLPEHTFGGKIKNKKSKKRKSIKKGKAFKGKRKSVKRKKKY